MICGCIDIGRTQTRLLVAEPADGRLRELLRQRAFTRIAKDLRRDDTIPSKEDRGGRRGRRPHRCGSRANSAPRRSARSRRRPIREASNQDEFTRAIAKGCGVAVEVLSDEEEARLAFVGATSALDHPPDGDIAVIDVGGSSSEGRDRHDQRRRARVEPPSDRLRLPR